VIEVGKIVKHGFRQRVRPIKPGYSVGHHDITCGTIGGFFLDRDGQPVLLSNNHVLANENKANLGDVIFQPGSTDGTANDTFKGWTDPVSALPYIGTLKKFVRLEKNAVQDSAIVAIHEKLVQGGGVDALYPTINRPLVGFAVAKTGMQVQKCGRTTGYTTGRVLALNSSFSIAYDRGPIKFNDCVVTTAMSKGGDSGSIIMDMEMRAVAHLFAGSPKVTLANPIQYAVEEYGLQIWNPSAPVGVGVDTLDFGDNTWKQVTSGGQLAKGPNSLDVKAQANRYCYLESPLGEFNSVSVMVNTGDDKGATWGPGLAVVWPTGVIKVNVRHGNRFGGYFNGAYNINIGNVKPNTNYMLRIRRSTAGTFVGEVQDGNRWFTVMELPVSIFPHSPIAVRVGKHDMNGGPSDNSEFGAEGSCSFRGFTQT
jgi:hypothetical protein